MNVTPTWLRIVVYRLGQVRQQLGFVPSLSSRDIQEVQRWLPAPALSLFFSMSKADQQHSLRVCRGLQAEGCVEPDMLVAALLHDVGKAQGRVPFWTRPVIVLGKQLMPQSMMRAIFPLSQVSEWADEASPSGLSVVETDVLKRSPRVRPSSFATFSPDEGIRHTSTRWADAIHVVPTNRRFGGMDVMKRSLGKMSVQAYWGWRRALSYAWWHAEIGADLAANAGLSERAVLYIRTHHQAHGPAAELHRVDEVS